MGVIKKDCFNLLGLLFVVSLWFANCKEAVYFNLTVVGSTCSLPSFPQSLPLPVCPSTSNATLEDAKAIAWQYAPVVYTHPLERYHLQSPDIWYNKSELFLWDVRPEGNSTYDGIQTLNDEETNTIQTTLLLPRSFVSLLNSTQLSEEEIDQLLVGAPFDENGLSTANVYYTVAEFSPSLWLFTYHLYYAWNGCSNQAFVLNLDGELQQLDYLMCPTGVHESDWCRVSVLVCKSDGALMQAAYSQHAWMEIRDCQAGQCPLEDGHPVAYAGLDGHGNYYEESPLAVYAYFNGSSVKDGKYFSLDNFGGVYIGDRAKRDPDRMFQPTQDNIKYLPTIDEIFAENKTEEFEWALYSGQWGAPLKSGVELTFTCINKEQTAMETCNQTEALNILNTTLRFASVLPFVQQAEFGNLDAYYIESPGNSSFAKYPAITGPLYRTYTYEWLPQRSAPIFSQNLSTLVCPEDIETLDPVPEESFKGADVDTIINYLWGISLGAVLFSLLMIVLLWLPVFLDPREHVRHLIASTKSGLIALGGKAVGVAAGLAGATSKSFEHRDELEPVPSKEEEKIILVPQETRMTNRSIVWATLGTLILIPGFVLLILGTEQMWTSSIVSAAADATGNTIAGTLKILVLVGLLLLVLLDAVAIVIVLFAEDKYIHIGKWRMRNYLGGRKWLLRNALNIHLICAGLMLFAITICAILFSLGWIVLIAQVALRIICSNLTKITVSGISLSQVCVTIPIVSSEEICGWEVLQTCGEITNMGVRYILFGGILLLWAHLVFLIMLMMSLSQWYEYKIHWQGGGGNVKNLEKPLDAVDNNVPVVV